MNINKSRAKLAGYLYKLTLWVAPPWPKDKEKRSITERQIDHDFWDDDSIFGERPF